MLTLYRTKFVGIATVMAKALESSLVSSESVQPLSNNDRYNVCIAINNHGDSI